ncbi:MAG TPA: DNA-3-methyladenine glycosylase [Tetragenococcus sp.]|nr:DNA-3-methyladenine glycosylase [Tetragenococcus sp.]
MEELQSFLKIHSTVEVAQFLVGMYLEHETAKGKLGGYIVDCEAYLGPDDQAAHSYGMRQTPRLKAMYQEAGTIYLYTMHTHLILNIITETAGIPQGVMIRALQPVAGIKQMEENRGKTGVALSNGPGKLVQALGITRDLYGHSIFTSPLRLVTEKRKQPKKIQSLARIGIPNKDKWTEMPLRFVAAGNPYITNIRKSQISTDYGWQKEQH